VTEEDFTQQENKQHFFSAQENRKAQYELITVIIDFKSPSS
jgi:hypothetical protein